MIDDNIIEDFWDEYEAYSLQKFRKNGYHYDTKFLDSAVLRIVHNYSKMAFANGIIIGMIVIIMLMILFFELGIITT